MKNHISKTIAVILSSVFFATQTFATVTYTPHSTVNPGDPITSTSWNAVVNDLNNYNAANALLRYHSGGEVGIGTSVISSGLLLDVEGNIGASGFCDETGSNCVGITSLLKTNDVETFAKTALPVCGVGEILKGDGTTLSCVTDIDTDTNLDETAVDAFVANNGYLTSESDPAVGSNSVNYLSKWNGSALVTSGVYDNGTNVGIGTASPSSKLSVEGDITIGSNSLPNAAIRGYDSSAADYTQLLYWSGADAYLGRTNAVETGSVDNWYFRTVGATRMTINSAGNVGIGTTSPAFAFDVNGAAAFRSTSSQIRLKETDAADPEDAWHISVNGDSLNFIREDNSAGPAYSNAVAITQTGNVGIGTTTPQYLLDIYNSGNTHLNIESGASSVGSIYFSDSVDGRGQIQYWHSDDSMRFLTAQGSKMVINSTGNVGIGTTSPARLLDVSGVSSAASGSVRIEGAANQDALLELYGDRDWYIQNDGDASLGAADSFHIRDATANASRLVIDAAGNVGIGTTSPDAEIHVVGSNSGTQTAIFDLVDNTANNFSVTQGANKYIDVNTTNGSEAITFGNTATNQDIIFDTGGNIGIGDTTPDAKLDVYGDVVIDGNITTGGSYAKHILNAAGGYSLPALGTKMSFLNLANSSACKVKLTSTENGYYQPVELYVTRNSTGADTHVIRTSTQIHGHSNDINFSSDASGNIWLEKANYDTGRTIALMEVEQLRGTCTVLSGATTDTANGSDESLLAMPFSTSGENVGLGTATPSVKFEVLDDTAAKIRVRNTTNVGDSGFYIADENNVDQVEFEYNQPNNTAHLRVNGNGLNVYSNQVGATIAQFGTGTGYQNSYFTGNVGIGTTAPLAINASAGLFAGTTPKLEVVTGTSSNLDYSELMVLRHNGIDATARNRALGYIMKLNNESSAAETAKMGGMMLESTSGYANSPSLHLLTNNTKQLTVNYSGNVGIGTTAPTEKLHVNGNIKIEDGGYLTFDRPSGTAVGAVGWKSIAGSDYFYVGGHPDFGPAAGNLVRVYGFGNGLSLGDDVNGDVLNVDTSGQVGIGTTTPTAKLHVYGGNQIIENTSPVLLLEDSDSTGVAQVGYISLRDSASQEQGWFGFGSNGNSRLTMKNNYSGGHIRLVPGGGGGNAAVGSTEPSVSGTQGKLYVLGDYDGLGDGQFQITGQTNLNKRLRIAYDTTNDVGFIQVTELGVGNKTIALNPEGSPVGIGTKTISGSLKLDIEGSVGATAYCDETGANCTDITNVLIAGSNSVNYVPKWNGSTIVSSTIYDNGTNVGIGLTNPDDKFVVKGNIKAVLADNNTDKNVAGIVALNSSGITGARNWALRGVYQYASGINYNGVGGDLDLIKSLDGNTILATDTTGTSLGNVGVGTTTPESKFQIVSTQDAALTGGGILTIGQESTANVVIDQNEIMARNNAASAILYLQTEGGDLYVHNSGDFVVKDSGNVGIGTASPQAALSIGNLIDFNNANSATQPRANVPFMRVAGAGGNGFALNSGGSDGIYINHDVNANTYLGTGGGRVGIGETSPDTALHVTYASPSPTAASITQADLINLGLLIEDSSLDNVDGEITTGIAMGYRGEVTTALIAVDEGGNQAAGLGIVTGNNSDLAERVRIDWTGRVGIGTTNPSELLVVGDDLGSLTTSNAFVLGNNTGSSIIYMGEDDQNYGSILWDASNDIYNFQTRVANTLHANTLVLDGGNVGIGTSSPSAKLDVNGAIKAAAIFKDSKNYTQAAGAGDTWVRIAQGNGNDYGKFRAYWTASSQHGYADFVVSCNFPNAPNMQKCNINVTDLTEESNHGIKGIRLIAHDSDIYQDYYLEVLVGNGPTAATNMDFYLLDGPDKGGSVFTLITPVAGSIPANYSAGTTVTLDGLHMSLAKGALNINESGYVGVGSSAPSNNLHVYDNDSGQLPQIRIQQDGGGDAAMVFSRPGIQNYTFGIDASDSNKFKIGTNVNDVGVSNVFTIENSGEVGIGTASPTAKLQINGAGGTDVLSIIENTTSTKGAHFSSAGSNNIQFELKRTSDGGTVTRLHPSGNSFVNALSGGKFGIGTNAPSAHTHILNSSNGSIAGGNLANSDLLIGTTTVGIGIDENEITSMGDDLYLQAGSGNDIVLSVTDTTSIGMGTATPAAKLHVYENNGNTVVSGQIIEQAGVGDPKTTYTSAAQSWTAGLDNSAAGDPYVIAADTHLASNPVMTLETGGNVGIGTSSPEATLHVLQSGTAVATDGISSLIVQKSAVAATAAGISVISGNAATADIRFGDTDAHAQGRVVYNNSDNDLSLWSAGTERMTIDSSGNIGVNNTAGPISSAGGTSRHITVSGSTAGTSAAVTELQGYRLASDVGVLGRMSFHNFNSTDTTNGKKVAMIDAWSSGDVEGGVLRFYTHDNSTTLAERMRITETGNVGIGATSPTFAGSGKGLEIQTAGANNPALYLHSNGGGFTPDLRLFSDDGASGGSATANFVWGNAGGTQSLVFATTTTVTGAPTERMRIDSSGNVGIGTTAPGRKLDVQDDANAAVIRLRRNLNTVGTDTGIEYLMLDSGSGAQRYGAIYTEIVDNTAGSEDGRIWFQTPVNGVDTDTMSIVGGNVGIGDNTPGSKLEVAGDITATDYFYSSDRRYKENIQTLDSALDKILSLRGVSFDWKEDMVNVAGNDHNVGLIAQEVEEVFPELVNTDDAGYKSVKYGNLVAPLIEAMKEQQKIIEEQNKRIEALEAAINTQ